MNKTITIKDHIGQDLRIVTVATEDGYMVLTDKHGNMSLPDYYYDASGTGDSQGAALKDFIAHLHHLASK